MSNPNNMFTSHPEQIEVAATLIEKFIHDSHEIGSTVDREHFYDWFDYQLPKWIGNCIDEYEELQDKESI